MNNSTRPTMGISHTRPSRISVESLRTGQNDILSRMPLSNRRELLWIRLDEKKMALTTVEVDDGGEATRVLGATWLFADQCQDFDAAWCAARRSLEGK